ncbi:MAG: hypothetical protein IPH77_14375 [Ignavibacteria bacterium]|nr:hypothetical protein [Ignavibacteria bacterium]
MEKVRRSLEKVRRSLEKVRRSLEKEGERRSEKVVTGKSVNVIEKSEKVVGKKVMDGCECKGRE